MREEEIPSKLIRTLQESFNTLAAVSVKAKNSKLLASIKGELSRRNKQSASNNKTGSKSHLQITNAACVALNSGGLQDRIRGRKTGKKRKIVDLVLFVVNANIFFNNAGADKAAVIEKALSMLVDEEVSMDVADDVIDEVEEVFEVAEADTLQITSKILI